jgi:uncharacterized membrane protein
MPNFNLQFLHHARFALALPAFPIRAELFWPYFDGAVILVIGLIRILADELRQKRGLDKIMPFGRLFYAIPLAAFGTEHFTDTKDIASIVPSWMPWHTFWVYLVGAALILAALSIILEKSSRLAATLLGCMFLVFVALIHIPNIVAEHGARLFWCIALRDTSFGGGAFALAGRLSKKSPADGAPWLVTLARILVGIPAIVFGVEFFLHPTLAPGVPLELTTPAWVPAHLFWTYLTGAFLIVCGACIVADKKGRFAATCLGIEILLLVLFIYLPIMIGKPDIGVGLNNFADTLLYAGAVLVLADAIREPSRHEASA